jgi:hypothetical protein
MIYLNYNETITIKNEFKVYFLYYMSKYLFEIGFKN